MPKYRVVIETDVSDLDTLAATIEDAAGALRDQLYETVADTEDLVRTGNYDYESDNFDCTIREV
jgi:hypothetical protein